VTNEPTPDGSINKGYAGGFCVSSVLTMNPLLRAHPQAEVQRPSYLLNGRVGLGAEFVRTDSSAAR